MGVAYVGNRAYDGADVTIAMLGDIPAEVPEISYDSETEHQLNYGLGRKPTSWSMGKESYKASISMAMSEVVKIEDSVEGDKDLVRISPFWIFVTYTNEYHKVVVDKLLAKFKNQGREVKGMNAVKQFDLFVLDIKYNIA